MSREFVFKYMLMILVIDIFFRRKKLELGDFVFFYLVLLFYVCLYFYFLILFLFEVCFWSLVWCRGGL